MAERVKVTVNLTQSDVDELKRQADKDGITMTDATRRSIAIGQLVTTADGNGEKVLIRGLTVKRDRLRSCGDRGCPGQPGPAASPASGDLDLTATEPARSEKLPEDRPLTAVMPFNPELWHERVRTGVAIAIIGAVIAEARIAGTVLGFYFGTHRAGGGTGG